MTRLIAAALDMISRPKLPRAVQLRFRHQLDRPMSVELRDIDDGILIDVMSPRDAGAWLQTQGYEWSRGSNAIWHRIN